MSYSDSYEGQAVKRAALSLSFKELLLLTSENLEQVNLGAVYVETHEEKLEGKKQYVEMSVGRRTGSRFNEVWLNSQV